MSVPIMRVNTVNPQSVIPGAVAPTSKNQFQVGVRQQQAQQDRVRKQEREDFDFEQAELKAERAPYQEMMKNPEMADMIAQQYGITIDDNIRSALKKPAEFDRLIRGGQAAKAYGITNPAAASRFAAEYMRTGDVGAAENAVKGMPLRLPEKPNLTPLRPGQGLYDEDNGVFRVPPDADQYNKSDPLSRLFGQIGTDGAAPMSPIGQSGPMTATKPLDPETDKYYRQLIGK